MTESIKNIKNYLPVFMVAIFLIFPILTFGQIFPNGSATTYDQAKAVCSAYASTPGDGECHTANPAQDGFHSWYCVPKEAGTTCQVSTICKWSTLGTWWAGCTNKVETCERGPLEQSGGRETFCVASDPCPDGDGDGIPLCASINSWSTQRDIGRFSDVSFVGDCDDKDPYSNLVALANIENVTVDFQPEYIERMKRDNGFTPKLPVSPNDDIVITIKLKPKCGIKSVDQLPIFSASIIAGGEYVKSGSFEPVDKDTLKWKIMRMEYNNLETLIANINAVSIRIIDPTYTYNGSTNLYEPPFAIDHTHDVSEAPYKDYPIKMTNCAQIAGSGEHKVVYERDLAPTGVGMLANWANIIIGNGFGAIQPIAKYKDKFSHFIDLKKQNYYFSLLAPENISKLKSSSCKYGSMNFGIYLDTTADDPSGNGWVASKEVDDRYGAAVIKYGGGNYDELAFTAIHEFGHAFGNLADEYRRHSLIGLTFSELVFKQIPHCSVNPLVSWSAGGKFYGGYNVECGVISGKIDPYDDNTTGIAFFKPSKESIMNTRSLPNGGCCDRTGNNKLFNIVSCGYLLKYIKNTATAKGNFAECASMSGIVPLGQ